MMYAAEHTPCHVKNAADQRGKNTGVDEDNDRFLLFRKSNLFLDVPMSLNDLTIESLSLRYSRLGRISPVTCKL